MNLTASPELKTMKSFERQFTRTPVRCRICYCVTILCALAAWSSASAETVRDNFESRTWGNNDGTANWSGDWIEVDGASTPPSPADGNVQITNGGELHLDDRPETNGEPSVARQANLAGATIATLRFDFDARNVLEPDDSVVVEISANGGGTWTILEDFAGLGDRVSGSRAYDIAAYATATTQIRIRVNSGYGEGGERFRLEYLEIEYFVPLADLSVIQTDTPDPVNVSSNMSYALTVANAGPEDATGVAVTDALPAGVTFQSASATQGSCTQAAGIVSCLLGDLTSGSNATINIAVTAPVVTGTITNSATVSGNEIDPVPANDASNENTVVVESLLTVVKAVTTLDDPINGAVNPKAIPGATMRYVIVTTNSGAGQVDTDTLIVTDQIPANLALRVADFDGSTAGPVQFIDGATPSGLSYTFIALDDPDDDVSFSDDGGASFDYEPSIGPNGADLAVTDIRISPKGALAGSTAAGDPSVQLAFKMVVE